LINLRLIVIQKIKNWILIIICNLIYLNLCFYKCNYLRGYLKFIIYFCKFIYYYIYNLHIDIQISSEFSLIIFYREICSSFKAISMSFFGSVKFFGIWIISWMYRKIRALRFTKIYSAYGTRARNKTAALLQVLRAYMFPKYCPHKINCCNISTVFITFLFFSFRTFGSLMLAIMTIRTGTMQR